jgi:basic membrane protein A and related proteins
MQMLKSKFHLILFILVLLSLPLAACGGAAPVEEEVVVEDAPLKVALLISQTPTTSDWDARGYAGLQALEAKGAEIAITEQLTDPDMESAFRDYASQGYDMIIGHSFGFGAAALAAAPDFPDAFFTVDAGAHEAENVASFVPAEEENHYLAGVLAALTTETGKIGFIGGFDYPSLIKEVVAFQQGAEATNPDIEVRISWVGSWGDPVKAQELALAMTDEGVDIILAQASGGDPGLWKALEESGGWVIQGVASCMESNPDICLSSVDTVWEQVIELEYDMLVDGTLTSGIYEWGLVEGAVDLGPIHDSVPADVVDQVMAVRQQIIDGELDIEPHYEMP